MKELHARLMITQEGLECFFAPALAAQPDVRAAGSADNSAVGPTPAVAAECTLKQIEALQRELAAVQESAGVTRGLGVLTSSAGRPDEGTATRAPMRHPGWPSMASKRRSSLLKVPRP